MDKVKKSKMQALRQEGKPLSLRAPRIIPPPRKLEGIARSMIARAWIYLSHKRYFIKEASLMHQRLEGIGHNLENLTPIFKEPVSKLQQKHKVQRASAKIQSQSKKAI